MDFDYAGLDRLYETGWSPSFTSSESCESLPDGRRFPSVTSIRGEFVRAGLQLVIKHNLMFNTYRATWTAASESTDLTNPKSEALSGTVVGSTECEAAVFALAQLRVSQGSRPIVMA